MQPWTVEFLRRYHRFFDLKSLIAYRRALIKERQGLLGYGDAVAVTMKWPIRQTIRIRPASNDHYTFLEIFEDEIYNPVCRLATGVKSIMDLGANIGLASLYMLSKHPEAKLVAVEPDPGNFKLLTYNLKGSRFADRGCAIQAAVWSSSSPLEIEDSGSAGHVNQYRVKPIREKGQSRGLVSGTTIQKIITVSGFETIDILKVDIEGAEVELLKGNVDWLDRVKWMVIEFHEKSRSQCNFDALMIEHGWKILDESPRAVVAGRM